MDDIVIRLKYLANKWKNANIEIHDICRDAAEEIRVLRTQKSVTDSLTDSMINHYNHGSGWGKGKDE